MPRSVWTKEKDRALVEMYAGGYVVSMIAANMRVTNSSVKNRTCKLQLKRNFYRRPFTPKELAVVRKKYPNTPSTEIARQLRRTICSVYRAAWKLGLKKSKEFMQSAGSGRMQGGSTLGLPSRFPKGHVPANKGLRRPGYSIGRGRMQQTQFKKGQHPHTYLPVGTVRANAGGYLRIKVSDIANNGVGANDKNWEFVHKRVWEAAHGPIPSGHRIWWKDRNHENCALENLELLADREHMARTTIHNLPPQLKDTIMLAGRLKRIIRRRRRDEEQTERPAKSSVRNHRAVKGRRKADGSGPGAGHLQRGADRNRFREGGAQGD
jgi:hypothetical protein